MVLPAAAATRAVPNASAYYGSSDNARARLVYGRDDALFGSIEKQQGAAKFGSVLDAGTGLHSLRWIATLGMLKGMTDFTAVTADEAMQRNCQREIEALGVADKGKVVIGNWFAADADDGTMRGSCDGDAENNSTMVQLFDQKQFDVILADYLIGAMDGFSPYQQDLILPKLFKLLKPGGRLYIVGLEPIPDAPPIQSPSSSDDNIMFDHQVDAAIVCKVRQVRDACILLAGHRCYREYPVAWIHRQIQLLSTTSRTASSTNADSSKLVMRHTKQFPILYRHATIVKQINVGRSKLSLMPAVVQEAMAKLLDDLEEESLEATTKSPTGRIQIGFDYVVTAEKVACKKADV